MKKFFKVLCLILLSLVFAFRVKADSVDAYLIATNPAENTENSMNISWHSDILGTYVMYTTADDSAFESFLTVDGECEAVTYIDEGSESGIVRTEVTSYQCKATLTDLKSNTKYIYRVGKDNFSKVYNFETSGTGAFTFMFISDVHTYTRYPSRINTAETMFNVVSGKHKNLKFVITGGDMLAYGTIRDSWMTYHNWSAFSNLMVAGTPGNHEYYDRSANLYADSKKYFNMYSNNPDNGALGVENGSYYFYYNNVLFISIDSEAYRLSSQPDEYEKNQYDWLNDVLSDNHAQFIVLYHHAYYYPGNDNSGPLLRSLQPVIDKYGVDLVLTGHDHVYTRSKRIYNSQVSTDSKKGAIYITSSAVGDRLEAAATTPNEALLDKKIDNTSLALGITVSSNSLGVFTYNETGEVMDNFRIYAKMDDYDTSKAMEEVSISYDNEASSLNLEYPNSFFGKAYNVEVLEGETVVASFRPEDGVTTFALPSFEGLENKIYKVNAYFRNDEVLTKEIEVANPNAPFGEIKNLKVVDDKLVWESILNNDKLSEIQILANGKLLSTVESNITEVSLASLNEKEVNDIEFIALDKENNVLFSEKLTYGTQIKEVEIVFLDSSLELTVGSEKEISLKQTPSDDVEYSFASSDESVVKIEGNKIIALKEGTATITIVAGEDVVLESNALSVTVTAKEEAMNPPVTEKKGCKSNEFVWVSTLALALLILRKKRY